MEKAIDLGIEVIYSVSIWFKFLVNLIMILYNFILYIPISVPFFQKLMEKARERGNEVQYVNLVSCHFDDNFIHLYIAHPHFHTFFPIAYGEDKRMG